MSASLLLSHHSVIFLVLLVSVSLLPTYDCAEDDPSYTHCKQNFDCGVFQNLSYPFWGWGPWHIPIRPKLCGGDVRFELFCEPDSYPIIDHRFRLLYVNQSSKVMGWIDKDVWNLMLCPGNYANLSVLKKPSPEENNRAPEGSVFLRLYSGCHRNNILVSNAIKLPCPIRDEERSDSFYSDEELGDACTFRGGGFLIAKENISLIDNYSHLEESACRLCEGSHGICGTNVSTDRFACLCRDGLREFSCEGPGKRSKLKNKTIVGVATAGSTTIVIALVLFLIRRRRKNQQKLAPSSFASQNLVFDQSSRGDLEKIGSRYYGVHVFTYAELEDATNNFDREQELGDGGFGTVYFGKLRDGRSVAVKRLCENNYKRVEQFMNEIDILTRLSHPNLVSLYGCTSRHSRELLLVYEYIPNGTVADHLHGEKARPGALPWHTRINIAVETASALAYLHASDVIHRDVKTNNILLDKNFNVKVADFGLSRLFPTDVTHVSTCPQGTPGYLDPEYHQCYQLTDKSDVYSFGVVLMELISSMTAVDITRHRHDINLSSMAMNKIQNDALHELVDPNLGYETDPAVRQMINAVAELGFTCLQMEKDWRPCMEEVLQKLQEIQTSGYSIENQK